MLVCFRQSQTLYFHQFAAWSVAPHVSGGLSTRTASGFPEDISPPCRISFVIFFSYSAGLGRWVTLELRSRKAAMHCHTRLYDIIYQISSLIVQTKDQGIYITIPGTTHWPLHVILISKPQSVTILRCYCNFFEGKGLRCPEMQHGETAEPWCKPTTWRPWSRAEL